MEDFSKHKNFHESLKHSSKTPWTKNYVENESDLIKCFNQLQIIETVEDLLTEDEEETDNEEYFTPCGDSFSDQLSSALYYSSLYDPTYESLSFSLLKEKCNQLNLHFTESEAKEIEKITRDQANSSEWHRLRKGRITASIFKTVCCTRLDKPSMSLLTQICYPEKVAFTSKYTEWGRNHEKEALDKFIAYMNVRHTNFTNVNSGLIVHPEYPYFGASPDGLCCCDCCGEGCIEIKCPYTLKNGESFDVLTTKTNPFLIKNGKKYNINHNHTYYFQVQMQLFLTKRKYCYFVVWNPKKILIINVLPDKTFWMKYSQKAESFFKSVVLPELLGKYFTNQKLDGA